MKKRQIVYKATLQKASRQAIQDSFSAISKHFVNGQWVGTSNRYRTRTIKMLARDTRKNRNVNHRNLAQYIAASAPLHCADGWTYLGRAIDCHSRGDADSARHLSYYAELRATSSLLATEGIGIFSTSHFVVSAPNSCHRVGGSNGTHRVAWPALRRWAELQRAGDLFGHSIVINGIMLREWIDHFRSGPSLQPTGLSWLDAWGIDLRNFSEDQEARNESSYRPRGLSPRISIDVPKSADFVSGLWSLCEPSGQSRFERLDRHLLRLSLEDAFKGITGKSSSGDPSQFKKDVSDMLQQLIPSETARKDWEKFLTRQIEPNDPVVLIEARQTDPLDHPRQHLQMISRASLLLRVATGACSVLLSEIGVSASDLKFWWSALGLRRGLWGAAGQPPSLTDLWADVDAAITGLREWEARPAGGGRSLADWWRDRSYQISVLGGCERIALWGLGL
jgi:hypothetical protein